MLEQIPFQFSPKSLKLRPLFDEIIEYFSNDFTEKSVDFVCLMGENVPENWCVDANMIKKICAELISNALNNIEVGEVLMLVHMEGKDIRITLSDTGFGMGSEQIRKTEKIFTSPPVRKKDHGLVHCAQAVQFLNGYMGVSSERGRGSSLWLQLPFVGDVLKPNVPKYEKITHIGLSNKNTSMQTQIKRLLYHQVRKVSLLPSKQGSFNFVIIESHQKEYKHLPALVVDFTPPDWFDETRHQFLQKPIVCEKFYQQIEIVAALAKQINNRPNIQQSLS